MELDDTGNEPKTITITTIKPSGPPVFLIGPATQGIEPVFMETYQRRIRINQGGQEVKVVESNEQLDAWISATLEKKRNGE